MDFKHLPVFYPHGCRLSLITGPSGCTDTVLPRTWARSSLNKIVSLSIRGPSLPTNEIRSRLFLPHSFSVHLVPPVLKKTVHLSAQNQDLFNVCSPLPTVRIMARMSLQTGIQMSNLDIVLNTRYVCRTRLSVLPIPPNAQ